jgi:hypothetical protein
MVPGGFGDVVDHAIEAAHLVDDEPRGVARVVGGWVVGGHAVVEVTVRARRQP